MAYPLNNETNEQYISLERFQNAALENFTFVLNENAREVYISTVLNSTEELERLISSVSERCFEANSVTLEIRDMEKQAWKLEGNLAEFRFTPKAISLHGGKDKWLAMMKISVAKYQKKDE